MHEVVEHVVHFPVCSVAVVSLFCFWGDSRLDDSGVCFSNKFARLCKVGVTAGIEASKLLGRMSHVAACFVFSRKGLSVFLLSILPESEVTCPGIK